MMGNFIEWKIESNCNIKTQLLGGSAPNAGLLQYFSWRLGGRDILYEWKDCAVVNSMEIWLRNIFRISKLKRGADRIPNKVG